MYILSYLERGREVSTLEKLPESCTDLLKAQARAAEMLSAALHEKEIYPDHYGTWAGICSERGLILSRLHKSEIDGWKWQNVKISELPLSATTDRKELEKELAFEGGEQSERLRF